jgi:hypothetical protein
MNSASFGTIDSSERRDWCVFFGFALWAGSLGLTGCADGPEDDASHPRVGAVTSIAEAEQMSLSLSLTARIGQEGPGAGPLGSIAVSPDSALFAVAEVFNPAEVNLYSAAGEHLGTLGGRGDGPGEFQNVMYLTALGDSLFVYDNVHGRETVYSFEGAFHRSHPIERTLWRALPLGDGYTIVNAVSPDGPPLRLMFEGEPAIAIPDSTPPPDTSNRALLRRALAAGSGGTFWSASQTRYRLDQRDLSGNLVTRLDRDAEWFSPHEQVGGIRPDKRPEPLLWDLHFSPDGHLWVLLHVADDRWAEQFDAERPADMSFNGNFHGYLDSIVEVIDVQEGRFVGSRRFDVYLSGFTSAGHLAAYHEPDGALPYIDVFSLILERR